MDEIWKPVPGYEGLYEVSNLGRVRSLDRYCLGKDGRSELHTGRILHPTKVKTGYLDVGLCDGVHRKHRTIHSLVAEVFLGPRPKSYDVMHLDGNKSNNTVANLRYGSRAENLHQTYDYGGRQANGKLTKSQAADVIHRLKRGEDPQELAKEFGVHSAAIYHIRNGTAFRWLREELGYA